MPDPQPPPQPPPRPEPAPRVRSTDPPDHVPVRVRVQSVDERIALIEAQSTAKEVASKYIGKHAVPWIVMLVGMGVGSSFFLPPQALPAVVGLVSTAVMALIAMLTGITGVAVKEERPEFTLMRELLLRLDQPKEGMKVNVEDGKVQVVSGGNTVQAQQPQQPPPRQAIGGTP